MVGEINKYYPLFKDDINSTLNWLSVQGLDKVSIQDVIIFYVGSADVPFKDRTNVNGNLKLEVTDRDFKVDFIKVTKRVNNGMFVYAYGSDIPVRPKLVHSKLLLNQDGPCRYMPNNTIVNAEDPANFTHKDLTIGRETSGKNVCDNLDLTPITTVRSTIWMPSVMYEDGKVELPIAHNGKPVPNYVVNTVSFIGKLGSNVYRVASDPETRNTNGVIVLPVLVFMKKLMDISQLIIRGGY